MMAWFGKIARDMRGATAVEYGLVVALIVIAVAGSISALGGRTGEAWNNIATKASAAMPF